MWPPALCSEDRSNEREREGGGGNSHQLKKMTRQRIKSLGTVKRCQIFSCGSSDCRSCRVSIFSDTSALLTLAAWRMMAEASFSRPLDASQRADSGNRLDHRTCVISCMDIIQRGTEQNVYRQLYVMRLHASQRGDPGNRLDHRMCVISCIDIIQRGTGQNVYRQLYVMRLHASQRGDSGNRLGHRTCVISCINMIQRGMGQNMYSSCDYTPASEGTPATGWATERV